MEITTNIVDFFAGDYLDWNVVSSLYLPSNGYSCKVVLISGTNTYNFLLNSNKATEKYEIVKTNTDTELLVDGKYKFYVIILKNSIGFVKQYDLGFLNINKNILTTTAYDIRSQAQKNLDTVRELLAGRLVDGVSSFTYDGQSVSLDNINDLRRIEKELIAEVNRELALTEKKEKGKTNRNKLTIKYNGIRL